MLTGRRHGTLRDRSVCWYDADKIYPIWDLAGQLPAPSFQPRRAPWPYIRFHCAFSSGKKDLHIAGRHLHGRLLCGPQYCIPPVLALGLLGRGRPLCSLGEGRTSRH